MKRKQAKGYECGKLYKMETSINRSAIRYYSLESDCGYLKANYFHSDSFKTAVVMYLGTSHYDYHNFWKLLHKDQIIYINPRDKFNSDIHLTRATK